jgi:hypothetical protein
MRPNQPVVAAIQALDLELLTRFDSIPLPDLGGKYDLALG